MRKFFILATLTLSSAILLTACISSSDDDEPDNIWTICGAVKNGNEINNPVRRSKGIKVYIGAARTQNTVAIQKDDGSFAAVVKLQGLEDRIDPQAEQKAKDLLNSLGRVGYFFEAKEGCTERVSNAEVIPGQLVDEQERSFSEVLLQEGLVPVDARTSKCGARLITNCQLAIATWAEN